MIRKFLVIVTFLLYSGLNAQSYTTELEKVAKQISLKIIDSKQKSVAVLDFENSDKRVSELGSWLSGIFTTFLENNSDNVFLVKNRSDLEKSIQQIKSESGSGAFDTKTIQRLGEISGSDVIIYGEITLMDNEFMLNIRAKNISLNSNIGGAICSFSSTEGMREKYGKFLNSELPTNHKDSEKKPSGEGDSFDKSKDSNCREKNTGDFCFINNTKEKLTIQFSPDNSYHHFTKLDPGQSSCFYDIPAGGGRYYINNGNYTTRYEGEIYIEACKEKSFTIR